MCIGRYICGTFHSQICQCLSASKRFCGYYTKKGSAAIEGISALQEVVPRRVETEFNLLYH